MSASDLSPAESVEDVNRILAEMQRSVRNALARHRQAGNPVPVWRDKKVCWIPAAEIPFESEVTREPAQGQNEERHLK